MWRAMSFAVAVGLAACATRPSLPPLDGCVVVEHRGHSRIDGFPASASDIDFVLENDPVSTDLARASRRYRTLGVLAWTAGLGLLIGSVAFATREHRDLAIGLGIGGGAVDGAGVLSLWRSADDEQQAVAAHNLGRCP
jgi:hypothetical protein